MKHPQTLAELRTELAETERQLAEMRKQTVKRDRLVALIRQWEALYEPPVKKQPKPHATPTVTVPTTVTKLPEDTGNLGYIVHAIRTKGPQEIGELLVNIRQLGWEGSGNDAIDKKRLHSTIYTNRPKVVKNASGKWEVAADQERAAS
jgi:hypothetical protein